MYDDTPLENPDEDLFDRAFFAENIANSILNLDVKSGFVYSINGDWGLGKTTTINFIKHYLNEISDKTNRTRPIVITFEPWWFSGKDQLLLQFFNQLKLSLKMTDQGKRLEKLGNYFEAFGLLVSPLSLSPMPVFSFSASVVSPVLVSAGRALKKVSKEFGHDLHTIRKNIENNLKNLDFKIIVIIDNIERLPSDEIKLVFRLVNAIANFPNITYILSFDKKRVTLSLNDKDDYGSMFIDKIIQAPNYLPVILPLTIREYVVMQLNSIYENIDGFLRDNNMFHNIFDLAIQPYLKTPRDAKRFLNVFYISYPSLAQECNPYDIMGIIGIQVFCPEFYDIIRNNMDVFCQSMNQPYRFHSMLIDDEKRKNFIDGSLSIIQDENRRDNISKLVSLLFPAKKQYDLRNSFKYRRVCNDEIFPIYFGHSLDWLIISNTEMREYFGKINNEVLFGEILDNLANSEVKRIGKTKYYVFLTRLRLFTDDSEVIQDKMIIPLIKAIVMNSDRRYRDIDNTTDILRLPISSIIAFRIEQLLMRYQNTSDRKDIFEKIINESYSFFTIGHILHFEALKHGEFDKKQEKPENERTFKSEDFLYLKNIFMQRLEEYTNDNEIEDRLLRYLLILWNAWGDTNKLSNYINKITNNNKQFVKFLKLFEYKSDIYHEMKIGSQVFISHGELSKYIDIEDAKKRANEILKSDNDDFNLEEKETLTIFIKSEGLKNPWEH